MAVRKYLSVIDIDMSSVMIIGMNIVREDLHYLDSHQITA
jgi:hypothetical protein